MSTKDKFEQIYFQYYRLMYQVAYAILQNHEDTEDVLQEAFFRIAKNISKVSDPICPRTKNYVVIICKNLALNLLKKRKGTLTEELPLSMEDRRVMVNPEVSSEEKILLESVKDAIRELPDRYRDCLYLSLFCDYTPKEIASELKMKEQSIYKRLKRGKQKLQKKLTERGLTYEDK